MKVGDLVRHYSDGDIGVIIQVELSDPAFPLYEIVWIKDGLEPLQAYGMNGENLEVLYEES